MAERIAGAPLWAMSERSLLQMRRDRAVPRHMHRIPAIQLIMFC